MTEDSLWIRRARQGDADAFEQLLLRYEKKTYHLALRLSENMLFLKDGKLLAQGPFAQAANRQFLQNVFEMDVVGYMQASRRKWDEVS